MGMGRIRKDIWHDIRKYEKLLNITAVSTRGIVVYLPMGKLECLLKNIFHLLNIYQMATETSFKPLTLFLIG